MAHVVHSEHTVTAVEYPSSDGKPVAESDFQLTVLAYAREALRAHFRARDNVYVAADLLIYYQEGNVKARVAPDVFVVMGAPNHERMSYLLWNEPKVPDWVLEITSRSTRHEDQGRKRELYRRLGVAEYWQYDPTGDYLRPPLQALRLVAGDYEDLAGVQHGDGTLAMASAVLGLELRVTGRGLRFHDPATGRDLLTYVESNDARQLAEAGRELAEAGRQRERQARRRAETRIAELEALLRTRGADGRDTERSPR